MAHPALELAAALLQDVERPVMLELGCATCDQGRDFRALLRRPFTYFGWECDPRLAVRVREERLLPEGGELLEVAADANDGEVRLRLSRHHENGGGRGSSTILEPLPELFAPQNFHWMRFPESLAVPSRSVTSFCQERSITRLDLLWADIEGAEARMLAGATAMLSRTRLLYLEVWAGRMYEGQAPEIDLLAMLPEWQLEWRDGNHVLLRNPGCKA
jgi:FkbM family methyltransferase